MKTNILIFLLIAYAAISKADDYTSKVIGSCACLRIEPIKIPTKSDSAVWLCVKYIYGMPAVNDSCARAIAYYNLRDTNEGSVVFFPDGNIELEGAECDSIRNDAFYIYRKIAEQSGGDIVLIEN